MTLMKDGLANKMGINQLNGQVAGLVKSNADSVTNADLNWKFAASPNRSVKVNLEIVCPFHSEYDSCNDRNICNALPANTHTKKIQKTIHAWSMGILNQFKHMEGYSLHIDGYNGITSASNFEDLDSGHAEKVFFDDKQKLGTNL